jgi:hypothetical protein
MSEVFDDLKDLFCAGRPRKSPEGATIGELIANWEYNNNIVEKRGK